MVEWLAGNRVAYADRESTTRIEADWSSGRIAMTGTSYGGTMCYEVATTGVEGLETIIPYCGIASWYDYTNSQGVAKHYDVNYADALAADNGGALLLSGNDMVTNERYGSWLYTVAREQEASNGKYTDIWASLDYSDDYENIRCPALIVQGLNDLNVSTRQADLMAQAFDKAGQKFSLVLHQDGHRDLYGCMVNDWVWDEVVNMWLCHYLCDVDNGIEQQLPQVLAQSNVDGSWTSCDTWRDFTYEEVPVYGTGAESTVSSQGFLDFLVDFSNTYEGDGAMDVFYVSIPEENAAIYSVEVPDGVTIYGVPKISFTATTEKTGFEGLMISAVLVDTIDGQTAFPAFMPLASLENLLPSTSVGSIDFGGGYGWSDVRSFLQCDTCVKIITFGWTDLACPGGGEDSAGYTRATELLAGQPYEYNFYMMPTVYTVQSGHTLQLVIYTWDPYTNAILDESSGSLEREVQEYYNYAFTIDNATLRAQLPVQK